MSYVVFRDPRVGVNHEPLMVVSSRLEAEAFAKSEAERHRGTVYFVAVFVGEASLPKDEARVLKYDNNSGLSDPWDPPF